MLIALLTVLSLVIPDMPMNRQGLCATCNGQTADIQHP